MPLNRLLRYLGETPPNISKHQRLPSFKLLLPPHLPQTTSWLPLKPRPTAWPKPLIPLRATPRKPQRSERGNEPPRQNLVKRPKREARGHRPLSPSVRGKRRTMQQQKTAVRHQSEHRGRGRRGRQKTVRPSKEKTAKVRLLGREDLLAKPVQ